MTSIFANERIGHDIPCQIEKEGRKITSFVPWTHAIKGQEVSHKELITVQHEKATGPDTATVFTEKTFGWKVLKVDV